LAPTDTLGLNPKPNKAPHVINNSWYCSTGEGCNLSNFGQLEVALNACRSAGIVVVVSAGNFGPGCNTITGPPAFFPKAFSVGATNSVDSIAGFSSRGLVLIDSSNRKKPDVAAPGVAVRSSVPGGGYDSFSGTSMAGPHVCGLVALIISANPKLAGNSQKIEEIIRMTAVPKTDDQVCDGVAATKVPNTTYGWGRINALEAVKRALLTVGNKDVNNELNVKVYPNPFVNTVYFEVLNNEKEFSLEVFDITGKIVFNQKNITEKNSLITVELNQQSGMYFYKLTSNDFIKTGKLIKL
jgi:serine protease AprX